MKSANRSTAMKGNNNAAGPRMFDRKPGIMGALGMKTLTPMGKQYINSASKATGGALIIGTEKTFQNWAAKRKK